MASLKQQRPELIIELNGGLDTPKDCIEALKTFDGAMVGRSAYAHPLRWQNIDELVFLEKPRQITASNVIRGILPYAEKHLKQGGKLWDLCRHVLQIVEEVPGARTWRRNLSLNSQRKNADIEILEAAARQLEDVGL